jgi:hypothetical protein
MGCAASAGGFCGGGGGGGTGTGAPVVGAGVVLIDDAAILVLAGDRGGTGAITVVLVCADIGVV